jgi:hypothetical protein
MGGKGESFTNLLKKFMGVGRRHEINLNIGMELPFAIHKTKSPCSNSWLFLTNELGIITSPLLLRFPFWMLVERKSRILSSVSEFKI